MIVRNRYAHLSKPSDDLSPAVRCGVRDKAMRNVLLLDKSDCFDGSGNELLLEVDDAVKVDEKGGRIH